MFGWWDCKWLQSSHVFPVLRKVEAKSLTRHAMLLSLRLPGATKWVASCHCVAEAAAHAPCSAESSTCSAHVPLQSLWMKLTLAFENSKVFKISIGFQFSTNSQVGFLWKTMEIYGIYGNMFNFQHPPFPLWRWLQRSRPRHPAVGGGRCHVATAGPGVFSPKTVESRSNLKTVELVGLEH